MLRAACTTVRPRWASNAPRRTFVSSVLLSKTYDDKTVAELRAELRARRLPVSGSKATLITRIQRNDTDRLSSDAPQPGGSSQVAALKPTLAARPLSTSSVTAAEPTSHTTYGYSSVFDIKLPDVSKLPPEAPVQIPFLPDAWNSYAVKQESAPKVETPLTPKIMLAAGAETHPAGGPTFAMSSATDTLGSQPPSPPTPQKFTGVLGDILDELGVPAELFAPAKEAAPTEAIPVRKSGSRSLDSEEQKGVYMLIGLLFGSWVLGGVAAPSS